MGVFPVFTMRCVCLVEEHIARLSRQRHFRSIGEDGFAGLRIEHVRDIRWMRVHRRRFADRDIVKLHAHTIVLKHHLHVRDRQRAILGV
jgi:hypothetical protein